MIKPFAEPIYVTRPLLPPIGEFCEELESVWKSQWLTNMLGPSHKKLENKLKKYLKVNHISLFNNGTIALLAACKGLELTGEVITTPFTFAATPHVLHWNRITPVFCDIDPVSMTIDPKKIEALITKKTTGILGVHVYGIPCETGKINRIAREHKLKVIFDAAHAFGTEIDGTGIGNFGDITMFSFHATKLFHTAEGGALTYHNGDLEKILYYLKNFGIKNEEEVETVGINGKMNEIQAALGLCVLKHIDDEWKKRKTIFGIYKSLLGSVPGITVIDIDSMTSIRNSYQYCVIRINGKLFGKSRDEVHMKLRKFNVFARKYFHPLCSEFACYRNLPSADPEKLPVATTVASEALSLPFYGGLSESDAEKICAIILS